MSRKVEKKTKQKKKNKFILEFGLKLIILLGVGIFSLLSTINEIAPFKLLDFLTAVTIFAIMFNVSEKNSARKSNNRYLMNIRLKWETIFLYVYIGTLLIKYITYQYFA